MQTMKVRGLSYDVPQSTNGSRERIEYRNQCPQWSKNKKSDAEESCSEDYQENGKREAEGSHSDGQKGNERSDREESHSDNSKSFDKRRKSRLQYQKEYRREQKIKKTNAEESQCTSHSNYKRTTNKQYSLLTHHMVRFRAENFSDKTTDSFIYWNSLTEKLNGLGPPYRTVQQWKKVWIDFISFHSKRNFKSVPKFTKTITTNSNIPVFGIEEREDRDEICRSDNKYDTSNKDDAQFECEEYDNNTANSKHADEYSDGQFSQQLISVIPVSLNRDKSSDSCKYVPPNLEERNPRLYENQPSVSTPRSLPPLRPSTNLLLDQIIYTIQHQMENQTKLLEHLSKMSSTIAGLMERQVNAIEKQTEATRRQASATEHHTLVMNSFIDMIRDKMPKANSRTANTSSSNTATVAHTTD